MSTDPLATLVDECYQRGLDAPEAAAFLRAAGVTLAPTADAPTRPSCPACDRDDHAACVVTECGCLHPPAPTGDAPTPDAPQHARTLRCAICGGDHGPKGCPRMTGDAPTHDALRMAAWARWIANAGSTLAWNDWACAECHPESDMLVDDFRCVYHEARAALNAQENPSND